MTRSKFKIISLALIICCVFAGPACAANSVEKLGSAIKHISKDYADYTWTRDVTQALKNLGGAAKLKLIYAEVASIRQANDSNAPSNLKSLVYKTLKQHCSCTSAFAAGNEDLYSHPTKGVWALRQIN